MTFTVTYRAKDGALREERIEAASRAECVAECRRRGIAPTGIAEGKPGKSGISGISGKSGKSGISGRSGKLWFAIGVALVIAIAGGAWWWFTARSASGPYQAPAKPKVEKPQKPKEDRPKVEKPKATNVVQQAAVSNEVPKVEKEMYLGKEVVSHSYITNATGRSVRETIVTADGKRHGRTTVISKPTFKYGTDQMLADVLFPPEHGQLPPWPEMDAKALEREFAQSLLDPIKILDDDPEDIRLKKEAVKQARSEMVQLLKEGHSVLEVIQKQREGNEHAHEMQLTVTRELHRMRREGASQDAIRDYLDKANQLLEQSGGGPVAEPERKGRRQ